MALDLQSVGHILGYPSGNPNFSVDASSSGITQITVRDATTASAVTGLRCQHVTTAVPANGFGFVQMFQLQDAANTVVNAGAVVCEMSTVTAGSHGAFLMFQVATGGAAPTEAMRIKETKEVNITGDLVHNNAAGKVGFFGAASVVQQANASAAGVGGIADAPTKAALTAIRTALVNLGLCAATA